MAVTDSTDDIQASGPPTAPFMPITTRAWWHRHLDPEERRRVMDELAITPVQHWAWRFTVMLTLSVVVAVMGLSADSAAIVIGAMLLAPLMTPVLASAACLSMSLMRKALWALTKVLLATVWCIAIAYLLSMLLPDGPLAGEVEARTRPDIRDLVVALAAGAAGSYATVRRDASSALPGVAVAVALVPPLATIGITLEANETDLAIGALLLYGTNLAAIIFAGVMVFIATGFVPPQRLANTALQLLVAGVIALAVVVVVAVPLFRASAEAVEAVQDEVTAHAVVVQWLDGANLSPEVDVENDRVLVRLRGFDPPPDDAVLKEALEQKLGQVNVLVEWVRTERATTTLPPVLSEQDTLLLTVGAIVNLWLADNDDGTADYQLEQLSIDDQGAVRIDLAGTGDPPSVNDLVDRFRSELGADLPVRLNWTPRETITPGSVEVTPVELVEQDVQRIVAAWAVERELLIESVTYDGERVGISVIGSTEPLIYGLLLDVRAVVSDEAVVDVLFTERRRITTTSPVIDIFPGLVPPTPTTTVAPSTATTSG